MCVCIALCACACDDGGRETPDRDSTSAGEADTGGPRTADADAAPLPGDATSDQTDARPDGGAGAPAPTRPLFDLDGGLFDAPFPIESRRGEDGRIRFDDFPNPFNNLLMNQFAETVDRGPYGYARNGAVFFAFDGPIDAARIPEVDESAALDSPILVIDVDAAAEARGRLLPFVARYQDVEATYHPRHFLTVLPYPGVVLAPERTYAVVVRRGLGGPARPLAPAPAVSALLAQPDTTPLGDGFDALRSTLGALGVPLDDVAVATVFTTGPEPSEVRALHADASARAAPLEVTARIRDTAAYCALEGVTTVPIYQAGERPYVEPFSGGIEFDDAGRPVVQWAERIRFSLAVPRTPAPPGGHPVLLYAPGGAGIYTQSLDRGTFAEQAADPENGRGPAHFLAQAGIATLSFEAALTGPRHPTGSLANLDFFNFRNLVAFRDNIRQAAAELSLMAQAVRDVRVPEGVLCDGIDTLRLDPERIHLYGHSTGSTVGAIAAGADPTFDAVMFSGAGGDWIYNLALKQEPVFIAPLVEGLLRMKPDERLDAFHRSRPSSRWRSNR